MASKLMLELEDLIGQAARKYGRRRSGERASTRAQDYKDLSERVRIIRENYWYGEVGGMFAPRTLTFFWGKLLGGPCEPGLHGARVHQACLLVLKLAASEYREVRNTLDVIP